MMSLHEQAVDDAEVALAPQSNWELSPAVLAFFAMWTRCPSWNDQQTMT